MNIKDIDKNIDQSNGFLRSQADSAAKVARTMACAMIGVVWATSFFDGSFHMPTGWLLGSLICGVVFFIIDLLHYLIDSWTYHRQSVKLQEAKENTSFDNNTYEKVMTRQSKISFACLSFKCIICFASGVCLLVGICVAI